MAQQRRLRFRTVFVGFSVGSLVRVAGSRVECEQQRETEEREADPIEDRIVRKILAETEVPRLASLGTREFRWRCQRRSVRTCSSLAICAAGLRVHPVRSGDGECIH